MAGITFDLDTEALRRAFAQAPDVMMGYLAAGVEESVNKLWRETSERTPRASDKLANSIMGEPIETMGTAIVGRYGTSLSYAEPVETGSRPHWAPIGPLEDWVRRTRLHLKKDDGTFGRPASRKSKKRVAAENDAIHRIARRIQRKIATKGTKGAFMFKGAFEANQEDVHRILNEAAKRGIEAINGL